MKRFYIYEYFNPKAPALPFYVGKGTGWRYRDISQKQRNKYLYNTIQKLRNEGYKVDDITRFPYIDLTEDEAFRKETELIKKWGRKDLKEGPLLNYTNGGEGVRGIQPNPVMLPQKDTIIALYQNGRTLKSIAKEINTTIPSVLYILKLYNVKRRKGGRAAPNIDKVKAISLYNEMKAVSSVAKYFNCDHAYLKQYLISCGVKVVDGRRKDRGGC